MSEAPDDELVCQCMQVTRGEIVAAIRAGARTVDDLKEATQAGTGCGSCVFDLEDLLAAHGPGGELDIP